jgi:hypothetical protein
MHVFFILVSGINSINFTSPTSFWLLFGKITAD